MRQSTSRVSVIIPVHDGGPGFERCLSALRGSGELPEIIVVDDASTDGSGDVARANGARVLRLDRNGGPSAARNCGAHAASGEILFFVDADVVLAPGAVERVARTLDSDPGLVAVFGSYDDRPAAPGLVSRYRNLLHHYVHQEGDPEASTFWAGCGAIRKHVFEEAGGFDADRYRRPSIEDIDLGYRLRVTGHRILLDKGLLGTHLKRWTLWSMIRTDVTCRAIPWAELILESGRAPNDLNLRGAQRWSVALVGVASLAVVLSLVWPAALAVAAAAVLAVVLLNGRWFRFLARTQGIGFAAAAVPLHLLHFFYSGLAYAFVRLRRSVRGRARRSGTPASVLP